MNKKIRNGQTTCLYILLNLFTTINASSVECLTPSKKRKKQTKNEYTKTRIWMLQDRRSHQKGKIAIIVQQKIKNMESIAMEKKTNNCKMERK